MATTGKLRLGTRNDSTWGSGDGGYDVAQVAFYADYADGANAEWAAATPSAVLSMTVRKEIADANGWTLGAPITLTIE